MSEPKTPYEVRRHNGKWCVFRDHEIVSDHASDWGALAMRDRLNEEWVKRQDNDEGDWMANEPLTAEDYDPLGPEDEQ